MRIPPARVTIPEEDLDEMTTCLRRVLKSGRLTLGPFTEEFESAFRSVAGTEYTIAVNRGTSALEIILRCLGVNGKTVIVPTNTFFATPAAVLHAGGRVKLLDVAPHLMINSADLEEAIDSNVAAVVVVHIGGYVHPEIKAITEICEAGHVPLIEDAAHAHGSTFDGYPAGNFGTAGAFSFYPTKVITAAEGGMITTDDPAVYKKARTLRDQGKAEFGANFHTELGYNWRMSELSAVVGLAQLRRLHEFIATRTMVASKYAEGLATIPKIERLAFPENSKPNFYKYLAILADTNQKRELKRRLKDEFDISLSGEVYETPCHSQPVFQTEQIERFGSLDRSEDLCGRHVCLPIFSDMTVEEVEYVLASTRTALE